MRIGLPLVIIAAAACGAGSQPEWRRKQAAEQAAKAKPAAPSEFQPRGTRATRYNDPSPTPAPWSPVDVAVVGRGNATAEANGRGAPTADARLYQVADELAALMPGDQTPPYDVIEFSLAYHGIVEPSPH